MNAGAGTGFPSWACCAAVSDPVLEFQWILPGFAVIVHETIDGQLLKPGLCVWGRCRC